MFKYCKYHYVLNTQPIDSNGLPPNLTRDRNTRFHFKKVASHPPFLYSKNKNANQMQYRKTHLQMEEQETPWRMQVQKKIQGQGNKIQERKILENQKSWLILTIILFSQLTLAQSIDQIKYEPGDDILINFNNLNESKFSYTITDEYGKTILTDSLTIKYGINNITIRIPPQTTDGLYHIRSNLTTGNKTTLNTQDIIIKNQSLWPILLTMPTILVFVVVITKKISRL